MVCFILLLKTIYLYGSTSICCHEVAMNIHKVLFLFLVFGMKISFIYFSVGGHLGCLQRFTLPNSAAKNFHMSACTHLLKYMAQDF